MDTKAIATISPEDSALAAEAATIGDLQGLTPEKRTALYGAICRSVGLNPLTKPFEYIKLNGKLTLYALKGATDQLRRVNDISITKIDKEIVGGVLMVTAYAQDRSGRIDTDMGAVPIGNLQGEALANAHMKAITKAKRRVTLSIAGLGWLDESEVDSIPASRAQRVNVNQVTGEIHAQSFTYDPETDAGVPPHAASSIGATTRQDQRRAPEPTVQASEPIEAPDENVQAAWDSLEGVTFEYEIDEELIAAILKLNGIEPETANAKQIRDLEASIVKNPQRWIAWATGKVNAAKELNPTPEELGV